MGVVNDTPRKQMFQGPLKQTDGALDFAISGLGFFAVASPNNLEKKFFTRDGSLNLNAKGEVLNQQGLALIGHPVVNNATYNPNVFRKCNYTTN